MRRTEPVIIINPQRGNDGKYINKKLPGRPKAGEVTLTRGLTDDKSFREWVKKAHLGDMPGARSLNRPRE